MCEWACSKMKRKENDQLVKIQQLTKDELTNILVMYGVSLENDFGYDSVYVANMCRADFYGSSITDDSRLARYVKDVVDDPDGYEGMIFTRFYADCIGSGTPINWEDMI